MCRVLAVFAPGKALITGLALLAAIPGSPVGAALPSPPSDRRQVAASLAEAEHAFARAAADSGTRAAFLAVLDRDGILFRPLAVNGREWFASRPASPGLLSWQPIYVEASGAGDLGWTTGPWEFRRTASDTAIAFGHYVSIWRKDAHGAWCLLVDLGNSHERPAGPAPALVIEPSAGTPLMRAPWRPSEADRRSLLEADRALAGLSVKKGFAAALLSLSDAGVRVYREGATPAVGRRAVEELLGDSTGYWVWKATSAAVARSGDLGFTHGLAVRAASGGAAPDSSSFVRIWRRGTDHAWKVSLDIALLVRRR